MAEISPATTASNLTPKFTSVSSVSFESAKYDGCGVILLKNMDVAPRAAADRRTTKKTEHSFFLGFFKDVWRLHVESFGLQSCHLSLHPPDFCFLLLFKFDLTKLEMAGPSSTNRACYRRPPCFQHPYRHIQSSLRLIRMHNCSLVVGQRRFVEQSHSTSSPRTRTHSSEAQPLHAPELGNIHCFQVQVRCPRDLLSFGDAPGKRAAAPSTARSTSKGRCPLPHQ